MLTNNKTELLGYMKGEPIMSNGWKCDKCGHYFETPRKHEVRTYEDNSPWSDRQFDLCDECKQRFDKWIEDKPNPALNYSFSVFNEMPVYADDLVYRPGDYKTPRVYIGAVPSFPEANLDDKSYPVKMLEEAAEVYSAWEDWREADAKDDPVERSRCRTRMYREICDVIQTCANMAYAVAKDNPLDGGLTAVYLGNLLKEVERKNREKGRYDGEGTK